MSEQKNTNHGMTLIIATIAGLLVTGAIYGIIKDSPTETTSVKDDPLMAQFIPWIGKNAPDFTVTDIKGTKHSLSDYKGKNVLVVFWATWCPACNLEIPHLIELRNMFEKDELAIITISNEDTEDLKEFVAEKQMNYTVTVPGEAALLNPFAQVTAIPTTFFIDTQGVINDVIVGLVTLEDALENL
ncbi:redoxin domain-containing protein [Planctomycetota bacterium]